MTGEGGRSFDQDRCLIECKDADVPTLSPRKKMLVHGDRVVSNPVTEVGRHLSNVRSGGRSRMCQSSIACANEVLVRQEKVCALKT